jgi:hypothetical protein
VNDQQPGIPTPEPTPPTPPVAPPAVAEAPTPERAGFVIPKWVAAGVAAIVVGVGGYAIGSATADDGSNGRSAGFSQGQGPGGMGQQGQSGQGGQGTSGGFGPQGQGGQSSQGGQSGGFNQQGQAGGGMSQNGPMTRSGGS